MTETKTKKPTKKEILTKIMAIPEVANNEEYVTFITHEIELLDKKNSSKGNSKNAIENESIREFLLEELAKLEKAVTVTEFMQASENVQNYRYGVDNKPLTNQKISSLFNKMTDEKILVKVTNKKKSYFSVAE